MDRYRRSLVALISAALAVVGVAIAADASSARLYIKARTSGSVPALGHFHPSRNPRYGAAVHAFGRPDSQRGGGGTTCTVRWASIGLTINFENFGGNDACARRYGQAQTAVIIGPGARVWSTVPGLRIHNRRRRLKRLYPSATWHGHSWWLVTARSPFGCSDPAGCPYPVLRASMRHHRVEAFRLFIGAAGE